MGDLLDNVDTQTRLKDYAIAQRIKDAEIVGNKSNLNPLQAPFAYIDGTLSSTEGLRLLTTSLKSLFTKEHKIIEDSQYVETVDKEQMKNISQIINNYNHVKNENDELHSIFSHRTSHEQEVDYYIFQRLLNDPQPIILPRRDKTWKHSNCEKLFESQQILDNRDIQLVLDEKFQNSKKNESKRGNKENFMNELLFPKSIGEFKTNKMSPENLSSSINVCLSDITYQFVDARESKKADENSINKSPATRGMNKESILKTSVMARNRLYRLHLEFNLGDYVLRWDIDKDVKSLRSLHRRLNRIYEFSNKSGKPNVLPFPSLPRSDRVNKALNLLKVDNFKSHKDRERDKDKDRSDVPLSSHTSISDVAISAFHSTSRRFSVKSIPFIKKDIADSEDSQLIRRQEANEKFLSDLEKYLDALLSNLKSDDLSLKVYQFLELSPMSFFLVNELREKHKEGYLYITTSSAKQGWRVSHFRVQDWTSTIKRHTSKWVILGDSYIMYTKNFHSTIIEDVFLVDSATSIEYQGQTTTEYIELDDDGTENENTNDHQDETDLFFTPARKLLNKTNKYPKIKMRNSERQFKLVAKVPKISNIWAHEIRRMVSETEWSQNQRFNSFAPIRNDCFAQWFVDARDYWYAASTAINMAKDVIYIHDWWLSPELYLRRPANGNQDWRIDRLLQKKANQGVKIYIIIYRNVGTTVVTDSMYTKHSLLDLHENIFVLRSPNQIMQNVFFWAHHEKLLIIDQTVCFLGGIDLCYGRYDTPDHVLVDDSLTKFGNDEEKDDNTAVSEDSIGPPNVDENEDMEKLRYDFQREFQIFPGKDYSNPRKKDFFDLPDPHKDMYNRQFIPRMPWHDVHMVSSGQIARDLSRHFIQRWNYLIRQKRPSRPTPLMVPPRSFTNDELEELGLKGTCEIQLLRSSCEWSLGIKDHEQSIQNAYVKCIEESEHFIYIENQFFVTSTTIDNTLVKNEIGSALVDRIICAHTRGEAWKAVIVIPLMPGFEADVDTKEGGSVRLIMQCQYMSISMGENSIFARLRRLGIKPEDYINFYSLRKWGLISDYKLLTTEQLYIHAKTMIVDDRIAIIGSANINERSMRGTRDSEVCAIVRDKDLIESKMDGKKYYVGKFAHSLRVRLMREHLGVDVDLIDLVERRFAEIEKFCKSGNGIKASILSKKDGNMQLSAMVELGTRYLLGLDQGTPYFNEIKEDESLKDQLTKEMKSNFTKIEVDAERSQNLDDLVYPVSFNHRVGNVNPGLRSDKNLSNDVRVANENHRKEVEGEIDGFRSSNFIVAKRKLKEFLKLRVQRTSSESSDPESLPYFEDIVEVLSQKKSEILSKKENNSMNIDRWTMIKRLFYMRRLYCKIKLQNEKEEVFLGNNSESYNALKNRKTFNNFNSVEDNNSSNSPPPVEHLLNGGINSNFGNNNNVVIPDNPLVSLTDEELREIDKILLPQVDYDFIDPYNFEDPLDISFFEGTWMAQAVRNTMLFRMVFHVQPDDFVQTWKDYKDYEEMRNAFDIYQHILKGHLQINESAESPPKEGNNLQDETEYENEDVEEHHRRLQRNAKLIELERFQMSVTNENAGTSITPYGKGTVYDHETGLKLMKMVRGHVVCFPTRWLKKEVESSNWFYKADKLPPIQIYD